MSPKLLLVGLVCLLGFGRIAASGCSLIHEADWYGPQLQAPSANLKDDELPKNWDWGNVNGKNYLSRIKNQKIPIYCGSCWAQSATSAISDRINILRGAAFPEISISTQVLLNCCNNPSFDANNGCNGGSHTTVLDWIAKHNITDESCAPYLARDFKDGLKCDGMAMCKHCNLKGECNVPKKFHQYTVNGHGNFNVKDLTGIMKEIYTNGPVICSINHKPIDTFVGDSVFGSDDKGGTTHAVAITGYGETDQGVPYWIMRNSFGEEWGDRGYIKIFRGNNTLHIEEFCTWVKVVKTWDDHVYPHQEFSKPATFNPPLPKTQLFKNRLLSLQQVPELPENIFFGNHTGTDYLSMVIHQNLPQPCNSSWAQAAAASLSDRINFLITKTTPKIMLGVQQLINCQAGGKCSGGDYYKAFEFVKQNGLGEAGCQQYDAYDPVDAGCYPIQQCMMCKWIGDHVTSCFDIPYRKWKVTEVGKLADVQSIKKELVARGPVVCTMMLTPGFEAYTGGVYWEKTEGTIIPNHTVVVVGYGKDQASNNQYWIVRNTWGTQFGESGYFRILMGQNNLGIEQNCGYAVPSK